MKKILLSFMALIGVLTAQAERLRVGDDTSGMSYSYLTFETTDGAKVSVSTTGLSLSISGTMLTAGSQTFSLSNLSKMYFSVSDEQTTSLYTFIINTIMNPSSDEDDIKKADINGDGKVNVVDIVTLTNDGR